MIESNRDSWSQEAPRGRSKQRQCRFGARITRRDFVNGVAAGAVAAYGQAASDYGPAADEGRRAFRQVADAL